MIRRRNRSMIKIAIIILAVAAAWMLTNSQPAWSHGGKSHNGTDFSSLQAVQKATELYERLIAMQKLPEQWETQLVSINIRTRQTEGKHEYIIQFKRAEGDPGSVYFFFDQSGEYSGSNFTGH